ncbi:acyl-CoA dehydrogenase family protein [Corallococcus sp. BB11-1]|uniref:acyl-CoA dehydrogenase family protein n=1 Tax=Corallococcus sp. BB11-1 TaxID=2996783 RepID=UPI0022718181|nr:acyl-CoA dehydrogenase [Corallococcus sp. BB11-1]MCY1033591.1 acyl-CoA dehydrogenase family protein [Corallococcus sp. BB11-1]
MLDATSRPSARELLSQAGLAPLIPMLYVAWTDGEMTAEELRALGTAARAQPWLDLKASTVLAVWVDPLRPPSPRELALVREHIRVTAERLATSNQQNLAELGMQLAQVLAGEAPLDVPVAELAKALAAMEATLGVDGKEAVRSLLPHPSRTPHAEARSHTASFNPAAMTDVLERTYRDVRKQVRGWLEDADFRYKEGLDTTAYRDQVFDWLKHLANDGLGQLAFPKGREGGADLGAFIAAFETMAFFDLSLVIKAGVHFGLFGSSILFLGTKRHHQQYLPQVASLELPGCFAMSELGHGSNVRDCETVARYDADTREFVIDTPSETARKEWIGNAARHARMATVFAQLEVDGEQLGVHALLVPLRDMHGKVLKGIRIEDCGEKMGLNGVDNGRLWFKGVRVPRENLLDRYGQVTEDGEYTSSITGDSKRFFTMLGALVAGRVSVACASLSAAKSALTIAVRYGDLRRQFGPTGSREVRLLDHQSHQLRLLPLVAKAYALDFALEHLVDRYVHRTEDDAREVEALAAGLKAYASWNATATVQEAREACGGQGYLTANRLPSIKADTDVFTTFEGDNTVLMQLVAKGLLTGYRQRFEDDRVFAVLKLIVDRAATVVTDRNPIAGRRTDSDHLRDSDFHLRALRFREEEMLASVSRRIRKRLTAGVEAFEAFNQVQVHLLALAHASVERIVLEQFLLGVAAVKDEALKPVLGRLADLFGLSCLESASGWFLEHGWLEGPKAKAIRKERVQLCAELRPDAVGLVDAFGIPDSCLAAPIGLGRLAPGGERFDDVAGGP